MWLVVRRLVDDAICTVTQFMRTDQAKIHCYVQAVISVQYKGLFMTYISNN